MPKIEHTFPIRLVSPNVQEHWTKRHKRNNINFLLLRNALGKELSSIHGKVVIRMIRVCGRNYDVDNLIFSFKGIKDSICQLITGNRRGVGDDDPRFTWEYGQEKGEIGVRIEIRYEK